MLNGDNDVKPILKLFLVKIFTKHLIWFTRIVCMKLSKLPLSAISRPSSKFLQTRFHEYQFHENCLGSQDAINVLMTSLIRRISRSKNRRGIFQLVVRWMERESHCDGKTGKSAAGRIRLSRELRVIARERKRERGKEIEREKEGGERENEREIQPRAGRLYRAHICRVLQIPPRDSAHCSEREKKREKSGKERRFRVETRLSGGRHTTTTNHRHRRRTVTLTPWNAAISTADSQRVCTCTCECVCLCHRLDSTALRDDGTTGGGK